MAQSLQELNGFKLAIESKTEKRNEPGRTRNIEAFEAAALGARPADTTVKRMDVHGWAIH